MELLSFPLLPLEGLHLEGFETNLDESRLTFHLSSRETSARCPLCQTFTRRVHSRYRRKLADLPCGICQVVLKVRVSKFFCVNRECERRIFTERLPEVVAPHARKTVRLIQRLQAVGLALGGAAGARLAGDLGFPVCGSTILNHLQKLCLPEVREVRILGVDDFAFRKGRQYGTLLVDLEKHQPLALLADRKAETLTDWLVAHPKIEVLSLDRSKAYAGAMTRGLPDATQVTDRFHLVQNLGETLEKVFSNYARELRNLGQERLQTLESTGKVTVTTKPTASQEAYARTLANHQRRVSRQREIKRLHAQKWSRESIAEMVGVSVRTVERFIASPDFPEIPHRRRSFGRGLLAPYKGLILEWWNGGIRNTKRLMFLLQREGYTGGLRTLQHYLSSLREAQGLPPKRVPTGRVLPPVRDPCSSPLTPRGAAYLVLKRPENRNSEDTEILAGLVAIHPDVAEAIKLAREFLELIRQKRPDAFDAWLMAAFKSPLKPFVTFAEGLGDDYAAVKASMTLNISNGPVEGLNNRLKMLKRQMYGRAGLELLSKRFILA